LSSRRRHTRFARDWSSDVCSSDLGADEVDVEHFVVAEAARELGTDGGEEIGPAPVEVDAGIGVVAADMVAQRLLGEAERIDGGQIGRASCRERAVAPGGVQAREWS